MAKQHGVPLLYKGDDFSQTDSPERAGRVDLSPQQDAALLAVSRWLKAGRPQVFRLFGYAGTGKTMLAETIAEDAGGEVLFAAFTGKAAQVMRNRGCANARTIHSLIYRPRGEKAEKETGELQPAFSLNRASPVAKARLIVVDECSMVDEKLGRDLLSFGTPVLVLGDPGQLPPVKSRGGGRRLFHRGRARRDADGDPPAGAREPDHRAGADGARRRAAATTGAMARAASSAATTSTPSRCSPPTRCWSAATAPASTTTAASAR